MHRYSPKEKRHTPTLLSNTQFLSQRNMDSLSPSAAANKQTVNILQLQQLSNKSGFVRHTAQMNQLSNAIPTLNPIQQLQALANVPYRLQQHNPKKEVRSNQKNSKVAQLKLTLDGELKNPKIFPSDTAIYNKIKSYVNELTLKLNASKEQKTLLIGIIQGELIKWAEDDVKRTNMTSEEAITLAASSRADFRVTMQEVQRDTSTYKKLSSIINSLQVPMKEISKVVKNWAYQVLYEHKVVPGLNNELVKGQFDFAVVLMKEKLILMRIDNKDDALEAARKMTIEGFVGASRIITGIKQSLKEGNHAAVQGYIFQIRRALKYYNEFTLAGLEVMFTSPRDGSKRYLDILLTSGEKIEAKSLSNKLSLSKGAQKEHAKREVVFEQQVLHYAAAIEMGALPAEGIMHYQFGSSTSIPEWALAILYKHKDKFPKGLQVNGKEVIKPKAQSKMGSFFSKK